VGAALAAGLIATILISVLARAAGSDPGPAYPPLVWSAAAVLLVVGLLALFVRRIDIRLGGGFPWLIGVISLVAAVVPWWAVAEGNPILGEAIYRGLRVPQGIVQFWDLSLVMQSVDCARFGFDVYVDNNGCMQDASIYAPGTLWLQYVPGSVFSQESVTVLGVIMMVITSLVLVWLARQSSGIGQIVLGVAALGAPWMLLLERGNIDAVLLWSAAITVILVRRWNALWAWSLAAALVWLMGTWKYYPFVMGLMLIPVLRLRRGWMVIAGFLVASAVFVILTWENVLFSLDSNSAMINLDDYVVLGRVPVVARMWGGDPGIWQGADLLVAALAVVALVWGIGVGLASGVRRPWLSMLAVAGASIYLVSVLVAGFGWGYKAVFLLLTVPLVSRLVSSRIRVLLASGVAVLALIGVQSVVVWNTVLATSAGLIAASFSAGVAGVVLWRSIREVSPSRPLV
jgi:hypothetical protein